MRYDRVYDRPFRGGGGYRSTHHRYDEDMRPRSRYDASYDDQSRGRYADDYWWLGEREMIRQGYRDRYDEMYRQFDSSTHPRYSPVGGMYPAAGGAYPFDRLPRPLRETMRFSDWTHWF